MAVDGAIIQIGRLTISRIQQLITVLDHTRAPRQCRKDEEFRHRQFNVPALPGAGMAIGFHDKVAKGDHALTRGGISQLPPAQHGPHTFQQQTLGKRFGDIVICPHAQPQRLIQLIILAGQENHRNSTDGANFLEQFHTIHARHLDIQHGEGCWPPPQADQGLFTIGIGIHLEPLALKKQRDRGQNVLIIVN